jgi:hypothetical protein
MVVRGEEPETQDAESGYSERMVEEPRIFRPIRYPRSAIRFLHQKYPSCFFFSMDAAAS